LRQQLSPSSPDRNTNVSDLNLLVVVASTRPGRVGLPVSQWFVDAAKANGGFNVSVADLAEENLPLLDEPHHPRLAKYEHDHTKRWSEKVAAADAFVFVIPEYNYGIGAALKNALDYLHHEWRYKPASVVSYGGVSAGTRSALALQTSAYALNIFMINQAVNIPFVFNNVSEGVFSPSEMTETAATAMLDELAKVAQALRSLRS
jgi:NAD(P)H-dependent FMN reductase